MKMIDRLNELKQELEDQRRYYENKISKMERSSHFKNSFYKNVLDDFRKSVIGYMRESTANHLYESVYNKCKTEWGKSE